MSCWGWCERRSNWLPSYMEKSKRAFLSISATVSPGLIVEEVSKDIPVVCGATAWRTKRLSEASLSKRRGVELAGGEFGYCATIHEADGRQFRRDSFQNDDVAEIVGGCS